MAGTFPLPPPFSHTTPPPVLLAQGAEARLYKTSFLTPETPAALKIRPTKEYRHELLDRRLTRQRVLHEARCMMKLFREGVNVPAILALDWEPAAPESQPRSVGAWLMMEWIEGSAVKHILGKWETWMKKSTPENAKKEEEEATVKNLMRKIGQTVGTMHKAGVVHGDLTTSNLILRPAHSTPSTVSEDTGSPSMAGDIVIIDFGLASISVYEEDRAVDLYVLERAFGSTHPITEPFFYEVLDGYSGSHKDAKVVLKKLEEVRMRGRKRSMVG